jgi:hypothetical protein
MRNVHDHHKGSTVTALEPIRSQNSNHPGWGEPWDALTREQKDACYTEQPVGAVGVVTDVESHGMNPWTRYSVRWSDGCRTWGLDPKRVRRDT